ncbi:hypothetical protein TNCV_4545871 [Trichonephila clavipes]|nr:hypothetical protein TNCV_4545871 [Trichonephila clavipes]
MPNSTRAVEFWAFHPRSATFNLHCPIYWKHLRYPPSSSVESRVLRSFVVLISRTGNFVSCSSKISKSRVTWYFKRTFTHSESSPADKDKMNLNLVRPCTNKEPSFVIKEKGDHSIEELTTQTQNLAIVYTDGSSDPNLDREGAVHWRFYIQKASKNPVALSSSQIQTPRCKPSRRASVKSAAKSSQKKRSCSLQRIPAYINIFCNEKVDELAKESSACSQFSNLMTLINANAAGHTCSHPRVPEAHQAGLSRRSLACVGLPESVRCHGSGLALLTNGGVQQ